MWVLEEADREEILKVTNRASQDITTKSLSRWKREQEGSSSEEYESMLAGDMDNSASVATES